MRMLAVAAVLTAITLTVPAEAQRVTLLQARTAGELADLCAANPKEPLGDAKINFCHGYAQGAISGGHSSRGREEDLLLSQPTTDANRDHERIREVGPGIARPQNAASGGRAVPVPGRTLPLQIAGL